MEKAILNLPQFRSWFRISGDRRNERERERVDAPESNKRPTVKLRGACETHLGRIFN